MSNYSIALFSGNANPAFSEAVANKLGIPLGKARVDRFSDGEIMVELQQSVRGLDAYVIQPTCPPLSASYLMELLVMIDTLKRSSAKRICAVIPYYGYGRQDRRPWSARVPITAKLVADMLTTAGADRVLTVDLHADQIQGFFNIPVDNIYGSPLFAQDVLKTVEAPTIVSPDVGGVLRARALAKQVSAELTIIDKRRPKENVAEVVNIIGDVKGKDCIIVDDMVDTAGTLCKASQALKDQGAKSVRAYCVHPVLSGSAYDNLAQAGALEELVVTDTIPLSEKIQSLGKVRVISMADMIAEAIRRIHEEVSVQAVYNK